MVHLSFHDYTIIFSKTAEKFLMAKMPAREKQRALKAKDDYMERYKGGTYYG